VLLDINSNPLGIGYISGTGQGGLAVLAPGNVITVAGTYRAWTSTQDGVAATSADLDQPSSVAFDGIGNMYIADSAHNKIRMVCLNATSAMIRGTGCSGAGIITTIAGTGDASYTGDNGPASASTLSSPSGLSVDGAGNLYIADTGNNVIREISAYTGLITTVAGNGTAGYAGDSLVATNSGVELNGPFGVTVDAAGNLYIADVLNQRIRRVDAASAVITTAAGNGNVSGLGDGKGTYSGDGGIAVSAGLSLPYAVAFDGSGNMYIPDSANDRVRVVTAVNGAITGASLINTIAGTGQGGNGSCSSGPATQETLNTPSGVAVDAAGNIYISDTQDSCIRKVNAASGNIVAIAMNGAAAISLSNVVDQAQVYAPIGITVDGEGNVFYADYYYMIVDEIQSNRAILDFRATPVRQGSQSASPMLQIVENDGNAPLDATAFTPDQNAALSAGTTTCVLSSTLSANGDCYIGALFAPSLSGNPVLGNIDVANSSLNTPLDIVLVGDATPVNSTNIALVSTVNPSEFGKTATFTATVTTGAGTGSLTGTVTFSDTFNGSTVQLGAPIPVNTAGVSVYSTAALAVGVHSISAVYNGDPTHFASTTPGHVSQTVYEVTNTLLTAAPASPSHLGASVTFTAAVAVSDGGGVPLSGSVTFTDNVAPFSNNTVALSNGTAQFTTNVLAQGPNAVAAVFTPDSSIGSLVQGSSGGTTQIVQAVSPLLLTSTPNPSTYGTPITLSINIPTIGSLGATGPVTISIAPTGHGGPTITQSVTLAGNPALGSVAISTLPAGTYSITASYPGDNNYAQANSASITQTVGAAQTVAALAATPNPGIAGKPVALTVTVSPTQGSVEPAGTVNFTDTFGGATVSLGTGTLSSSGTFSINPMLSPGMHSIAAAYAGNSNDTTSSATLALTVVQASTTTTVAASPSPAIVNSPITFFAVIAGNGATPTGTVSFFANGTITLGAANLDATGKAQVTNSTLSPGSYQITATYAGDTNDAGSTSAAIAEVVGTIPTQTGLSTAATPGPNSQTILVATVQDLGIAGVVPTGTVTFTNGTTTIGAAALDSSGVATLSPQLGTSSYNIVASYAGDGLHSPSVSVALPVSGISTTFAVGVNPSTVTMATSQSATVNVSLASFSGFTDTISLGCVGLPAGMNCHFSNIDVPLAANGTATAQLTIDTNNPLGGGSSAMNMQPGKQRTELAGLFVPLSLFFGWVLWSLRKRHAGLLSAVFVIALTGAALLAAGCGGFSQTTAAPGTYIIQVTGVGTNSNVTQYQAVTLTITQ
jgi:sugar lactone lactonase YvrE